MCSRLEVGYGLYGHELSEEISALESGLTRFIDFEKEFIGKDALLKQQDQASLRRIIGLISDTRRSLREGHTVFDADGKKIGEVTSGAFSPHLNKGIGLALIQSETIGKDDAVFFGNDKQKEGAVVSSKIFYRSGSLKS